MFLIPADRFHTAKAAVLYLSVSPAERAEPEDVIVSQLRILKPYAVRHGYHVLNVYVDRAHKRRTGTGSFQRLAHFARSFSPLHILSASRARFAHVEERMYELAAMQGRRLHVVDEGIEAQSPRSKKDPEQASSVTTMDHVTTLGMLRSAVKVCRKDGGYVSATRIVRTWGTGAVPEVEAYLDSIAAHGGYSVYTVARRKRARPNQGCVYLARTW